MANIKKKAIFDNCFVTKRHFLLYFTFKLQLSGGSCEKYGTCRIPFSYLYSYTLHAMKSWSQFYWKVSTFPQMINFGNLFCSTFFVWKKWQFLSLKKVLGNFSTLKCQFYGGSGADYCECIDWFVRDLICISKCT